MCTREEAPVDKEALEARASTISTTGDVDTLLRPVHHIRLRKDLRTSQLPKESLFLQTS
jgi:hypothetical protein